MNIDRMLNMAFRMLLRRATYWASKRAKDSTSEESGTKDRRAFRGNQPDGDAAKRMRALKRFTKL